MGPIAIAVKHSIDLEADDLWAMHGGRATYSHMAHMRHSGPDGWDPQITKRLATVGISQFGRLTHVTRPDGSERPVLIFMPGDFS